MPHLAFCTQRALELLLSQVDKMGGWLTPADVMARCQFDQGEFVARHNNNALLVLRYGGGLYCPAFQLQEHGINPHIPTLLSALSSDLTAQEKIAFFLLPQPICKQRNVLPAEWIQLKDNRNLKFDQT